MQIPEDPGKSLPLSRRKKRCATKRSFVSSVAAIGDAIIGGVEFSLIEGFALKSPAQGGL
ncbi:hypothetical protein [Thioalkalivibrio sp. HK1]|uniref:hypothetical protein n=1 Tax=Thioalkalivibrio sp. HK1 TaxID=1469245 RepID=UPI0018CC543C|nr:hypothetical protein [Thioalkalivibrio sp. HK1]